MSGQHNELMSATTPLILMLFGGAIVGYYRNPFEHPTIFALTIVLGISAGWIQADLLKMSKQDEKGA